MSGEFVRSYCVLFLQNFFFPRQIESSSQALMPLEDTKTRLDQIIEELDAGLQVEDVAILRKRVTCGMGRSNPVEKVIYVDKRGKSRTFTSELLRKNLPRELSSETYIFVVKKIDGESVREATSAVRLLTTEQRNEQK